MKNSLNGSNRVDPNDIKAVHKLCRPFSVRPLVSRYTGEISLEACSGTLKDPDTGKYAKQRRAFKISHFDSVEDALAAARTWISDMRGVTREEKSAVLALPMKTRNKLLVSVERCERKGYDINEVIDAGIAALDAQKVAQEISFNRAADVVIGQKLREERSELYVRELRFFYNYFGKTFGGRKLHEITAEEVEDWLEDCEVGNVTWNNYRRQLAILWNFGLEDRNGWVKHNVIEGVIQKQEKVDEVTALTLAQAKAVLATAHSEVPRLVPYLVVGMFAGLRRSEAQVAKWEDIDWETNSIKVRGGKMRSATSRFVDLAPVALDWLKPLYQKGADLCPGPFARRADLKRLRELTFDFDSNIFRHSFGSYHSAFHKNWNLTAAEMGHESVKMLMKRYRKPVPTEVAAKFWALDRSTVLARAAL